MALARALRRLGAPVALKWPNDVLLNERKLAGILIELSGDALGPTAVVIGIGMNVSEPGDVDQPVACLADAGVQLTRSALLAELLNELHLVLGNFDRNGFVPLRGSGWVCRRIRMRRCATFLPWRASGRRGARRGRQRRADGGDHGRHENLSRR